ncbi:hypothetical protein HPB47_002212, partial [Ixodes persulcatus]
AKGRSGTSGKERALRHFDEFYSGVYGTEWPSIRLALLCPNKPCAVLNSFLGTSDETLRDLQAQGALSLGALYERRRAAASAPLERSNSGLELLEPEERPEQHDPSPATPFDDSARLIRPGSSLTAGGGSPLLSFVPSTRTVYQEEQVSEGAYYDFYRPKAGLSIPLKRWEGCRFPEKLNVALFGTGDLSEFRRPRRRANDLLEYYLMDGASILPVLALDLQKGDVVGDFCAAPGGKLLATRFTLLPARCEAYDQSPSRLKRLQAAVQSYVPDSQLGSVRIQQKNILEPNKLAKDSFDKVLATPRGFQRAEGAAKTPSKKHPKSADKTKRISNHNVRTLTALRSCVRNFFLQGVVSTPKKIAARLRDDDDVLAPCSETILYRPLKGVGFEKQKRNGNSFPIEREHILEWRRRYLRVFGKHRAENRKICFKNEI